MGRRLLISFALVAIVATTPGSAAGAEQRIAPGVTAGGVDLSNLTIEEAAARLATDLGPAFQRPVDVAVAGRVFRLTAAGARVSFDALLTAKRAYYAGRDRPPVAPGAGGTGQQTAVPLAVTHRRSTVRAFAEYVAGKVRISARNATVRITVRRMIVRRAKIGRAIDARRLAETVDATFADPRADHLVRPKRRRVRPRVNANDLRRTHGTVLTIDRTTFKLRLFKRLRLRKTYGIALGAAGFDTPSGLFRVTSRQVNPAWHAPNRPWAGAYAGKTIPGGAPNNPLKARWLGIVDGVGIHGTAEEWSIGSRASHGCIRMRVSEVIDLYPRVPLGTPVLIR